MPTQWVGVLHLHVRCASAPQHASSAPASQGKHLPETALLSRSGAPIDPSAGAAVGGGQHKGFTAALTVRVLPGGAASAGALDVLPIAAAAATLLRLVRPTAPTTAALGCVAAAAACDPPASMLVLP